jgi:hypothetical protein
VSPTHVTGDLQEVHRKTAGVLGMKPLLEEAGALKLGVQVLCLPSFDNECGLNLVVRDAEAFLDVHCAKRSIWAYLNGSKGTPGFGTVDSWVEPAVAIEKLTPNHDEVRRIHDAVMRLETWMPKERGIVLDGMRVRVEVAGQLRAKQSIDLWFSADSETEPGRLVRTLWDIALAHCTWDLTRSAVTALQRYS